MQQKTSEQTRKEIVYPRLPLTVYREIVAHLQQVEGVKAGVIPYLSSKEEASLNKQFDYQQSQVKGLWIEYDPNINSTALQRIEDIIGYYCQLYNLE